MDGALKKETKNSQATQESRKRTSSRELDVPTHLTHVPPISPMYSGPKPQTQTYMYVKRRAQRFRQGRGTGNESETNRNPETHMNKTTNRGNDMDTDVLSNAQYRSSRGTNYIITIVLGRGQQDTKTRGPVVSTNTIFYVKLNGLAPRRTAGAR